MLGAAGTAREGQEVTWGHQTPLPSQPGGEMSLPSRGWATASSPFPLVQVGSGRSRAGTPPPPPWQPREGESWSKGASRTAGELRKVSAGPQTLEKSHLQRGKLQLLGAKRPGAPSHPREMLSMSWLIHARTAASIQAHFSPGSARHKTLHRTSQGVRQPEFQSLCACRREWEHGGGKS